MKLYLYQLQRRDVASHDEALGFIVCATSTEAARNFAASQAGDEGPAVWFQEDRTHCFHVGDPLPEERPRIILRNFLAG